MKHYEKKYFSISLKLSSSILLMVATGLIYLYSCQEPSSNNDRGDQTNNSSTSKPSEEGEGIPGYLTDPKLVKVRSGETNESVVIVGQDSAVNSDSGGPEDVIAYAWSASRTSLGLISSSNEGFGYISAELISEGKVDENGAFELTIPNNEYDLLIVSMVRYVDSQTRVDLQGDRREGVILSYSSPEATTDFVGVACHRPPCGMPIGYGNGSFGEPLELPSPGRTNSFSARRVGNEVEIVTGNILEANTKVRVSTDWAFSTPVNLDSFVENSSAQSTADYNGDGIVDIALSNEDDTDYVYIADSGENVSSRTALSIAEVASHKLRSADMDNDGDIDIVASANKYEKAVIYLNDGQGEFPTSVEIGEGDSDGDQLAMDVGDVNNDGKVDVVYARWDKQIYVFHNSGDLLFSQYQGTYEVPSDPDQNRRVTRDLKLVDLDLDGDLDLVTSNKWSNTIFINTDGKGHFSEQYDLPEPRNSFGLAVVDLNADTFPDLVFQNRSAKTQIFLNNKMGGFENPFEVGPSIDGSLQNASVIVADFNNDRKLDILLGDIGLTRPNVILPGQ